MATFQPDFYVTCATIIPLLFLTVAVQGTSYQNLLDAIVKAARPPVNAPPLRQFWAYAAGSLTLVSGFFVVGLGLWGELAALYALYLAREDGKRGLVLAATLILLVAAAVEPLQRAVLAIGLSAGWAPADPSLDHQSVGDDDEQADNPDDDGTDAPETGGSTA
jgi:hypothetical protein